MTDQATIVSIVALCACVVLAMRGLRGRNIHRDRMLLMGVIWMVIIAGLAFIFQQLAS